MPGEAMQCPKCGSILHVESGHRHIWCTYCGSQLRITSGSSGHPFAVLDDIRADTALLAKHQALGHLSKYRDELMEERGERHAQREELLPRTVAVPTEGAAKKKGLRAAMLWGAAASLALLCLCGITTIVSGEPGGLIILMVFLVLGVMAISSARAAEKERARLLAQAEEEKEAARAAVAECEERIRAIDAELDKVWLRIYALEKDIRRLSMEI